MTIEVKRLHELDIRGVQQTQAELAELMREFNPRIDTRYGVLHDLLFYNEALYAEKAAEEMRRLGRSNSLLEIAQDPDLADDATVEATASNHRVTRRQGSAAAGEITIIVSALAPLTVPSGSVWEANGKQFITQTAFAARTSEANVQAGTDRVLNPVGDGTYSFTIELTAAEVGESGQVVKDTAFVPEDTPRNFVQAYAAADFAGGTDPETNEDLVGRAIFGDAAKALSSNVHMRAALRAQEAFANITHDSIVGFGDAEMLRDQHSIFPGSLGGRVDWYVRTQKRVRNVGLTKSATLVELTDRGTSIWQFGVGRDDLPGFFDVAAVTPLTGDTTSFDIVSDQRALDRTNLNNDGFLPDLATTIEGVYSRFQSAVIQFEDTQKDIADLAVGDTANYRVTLRGLPLIAEIQDWASARDVRNRAGDALIKAPVPCFLRVSFTIEKEAGQADPDTDEIANALVDLVNTWGFGGVLPASALTDTIHDYLTGRSHVSAVDILADIRRPDGVIRRFRTSEILAVPNEPAQMVTPRTVAFFLDPEDIAISVVQAKISS